MPSAFSTTAPALRARLHIAASLTDLFDETAVTRDHATGTLKAERDLLRERGLLSLSIPQGYGGNWATTLQRIRTIARSDSSIAHVYAFHHLMLATVRLVRLARAMGGWLSLEGRTRPVLGQRAQST